MANENPESEGVVNGQPEPTTPGGNTAANTSASRKASTTATPAQKQTASNLAPVTTTSACTSPRTSRNTSPIRKDSRQQPLSTPSSSQPSAAAIQRALSAANVPQLQSGGGQDAASKLPKPPTPKSGGASGENTPRWPTSPRLKSPPPSATNSRRGSSAAAPKKAEAGGAAPSINVQNATPQTSSQTSTPPPAQKQGNEEPVKLQTPQKGPSRGPSGKSTLETVQENSVDDVKEPSPAAVKAAADLKPLSKISEDEGKVNKTETAGGENESHASHAESGSESAGTKNEKKKDQKDNTQRPKNAQTKSYASLSSTKSRQQEGKQGMTVETETVPSIPQSAINSADRSASSRNDNSGSVRLKPSNETIRPKKERKKASQKPRSITQGTASSKADIFENRVANAMDEANSSDSDETFVYESNPPETQRRARHHSRTPSVTSSHSAADGQRSAGMRSFGDPMDERRVAGKRSMKFSNNAFNDVDSPDSKDGSVRSHTPRHFGRFGRGGNHASVFDQDSPFTQASKLRSSQLNTRHSRPNSPRSPQPQQRPSGLFGKKQEPSYDFDAEGGDDERAPLLGTVRTPRSGRLPRRIQSSHSIDDYYGVRRHGRCGGRFGGCLLGFVVFVAVILSALAFLVMSNRPMYGVQISKIEDVLASEQELMLDLQVVATNPNALAISIADMDLRIFAKSKHVGTGAFWREHEHEPLAEKREEVALARRKRRRRSVPAVKESGIWQDLSSHWRSPSHHEHGGVDEGTDPPDDDDLDRDAQTMLLGRIFHFDQGLTFEGSPLKRHQHTSTGEISLNRPGNRTETGGSARWENVLQHPFELIIRGVLKYQLPISSRMERAAVGGSVLVHPEEGVDGLGRMRVEEVDRSEQWEWIDWDEVKEDDRREEAFR